MTLVSSVKTEKIHSDFSEKGNKVINLFIYPGFTNRTDFVMLIIRK